MGISIKEIIESKELSNKEIIKMIKDQNQISRIHNRKIDDMNEMEFKIHIGYWGELEKNQGGKYSKKFYEDYIKRSSKDINKILDDLNIEIEIEGMKELEESKEESKEVLIVL